MLVIPPDLAYGAQSPSPRSRPNETLVFVVDLEQIGSSGLGPCVQRPAAGEPCDPPSP